MAPITEDSAILQAILEAAVDAIIVSDQTGQILRANDAAARLFQFDVSEMTGCNVNMLMPQALAELHDGFMSHHIETGEKRIIGLGREVEGQRKDKSVFPLHLSVGSAQIGTQRLFIAILHDLTTQKSTEQALARSQRMDAIGQMTGGIAHDFNNLLTVIIGNLELLEMRGAQDRQLPLINDALESAELGADLTSRLMVFGGRSNLKPEEIDLRAHCTETLKLLERTLGANYRIDTQFAPDVDPVLVDPVELQSALMNLALNARDAMGDGGVLLVTIENVVIDDTYMAQETDIAPGHYVRLSISDNGAGMDAEAQRRAFEPFFTTKADSGGTGLGLSTVYGFVRQSGGHVTLYSEIGMGSSFGLYFPAHVEARDAPTLDPAPRLNDKIPFLEKGKTVLIVEDNPKVRRLSIERIRDLGFATLEAENGDQAYDILKSGVAVDIVFSDLVMPGGLNGYDLAALVVAEFPQTKVMLTSGYASDVVTGKLAHGERYDILHKPYHQSELAERLYALLSEDSDG